MAEAEAQASERCKALTESGDRCQRSARDDGFCYQHDESDPTIDDDADGDDESGDQPAAEGSENAMNDTTDDNHDTDDSDEADAADDGDKPAVLRVRESVEMTAEDIIGRDLDGVLEVTRRDGEDVDGWRVVVEVIERPAIPNTQDILGQYEIDLDDDADVEGYRRIARYRRSDTEAA